MVFSSMPAYLLPWFPSAQSALWEPNALCLTSQPAGSSLPRSAPTVVDSRRHRVTRPGSKAVSGNRAIRRIAFDTDAGAPNRGRCQQRGARTGEGIEHDPARWRGRQSAQVFH